VNEREREAANAVGLPLHPANKKHRRAEGDCRRPRSRVVESFAREGARECRKRGVGASSRRTGFAGPASSVEPRVGLTSLGPSFSLVTLPGTARGNGGQGGSRGSRGEEVGRPTTPPGACPESACMVYRARLITSRGRLHRGGLQSLIFI
jgi:hypothetical protein